MPDRDDEICLLRAQGLTLREIATRFGVSHERVRQVLQSRGGPPVEHVRAVRDAARNVERQGVRERVTADLLAHPGSTVDEVAGRLGLRVADVNSVMTARLRRMIVRPASRTEVSWSDEAMLEALRSAATYQFPLTVSGYARLLRCGEVVGASVASVEKRFGSWVAACARAGVEPGRRMRPDYQSTWTDADLFAYVSAYLKDDRYPGTYGGYGRWRVAECPEAPSALTVRNRLGSWAAVKRRVLTELYDGALDVR